MELGSHVQWSTAIARCGDLGVPFRNTELTKEELNLAWCGVGALNAAPASRRVVTPWAKSKDRVKSAESATLAACPNSPPIVSARCTGATA